MLMGKKPKLGFLEYFNVFLFFLFIYILSYYLGISRIFIIWFYTMIVTLINVFFYYSIDYRKERGDDSSFSEILYYFIRYDFYMSFLLYSGIQRKHLTIIYSEPYFYGFTYLIDIYLIALNRTLVNYFLINKPIYNILYFSP